MFGRLVNLLHYSVHVCFRLRCSLPRQFATGGEQLSLGRLQLQVFRVTEHGHAPILTRKEKISLGGDFPFPPSSAPKIIHISSRLPGPRFFFGSEQSDFMPCMMSKLFPVHMGRLFQLGFAVDKRNPISRICCSRCNACYLFQRKWDETGGSNHFNSENPNQRSMVTGSRSTPRGRGSPVAFSAGSLISASSGATSKTSDSRIPDSVRLNQKPWEGHQR